MEMRSSKQTPPLFIKGMFHSVKGKRIGLLKILSHSAHSDAEVCNTPQVRVFAKEELCSKGFCARKSPRVQKNN